MSKMLSQLVGAAVAAAVPLVLVFVGLRLVTAEWFIRWEYGKESFPPDPFGLAAPERIELASVCVNYLARSQDLAVLEALRLPDGEPAFNDRELQHMDDVQGVFDGLTIAGIVGSLVVVVGVSVLWWIGSERRRAPNALAAGGLITLGVLLVLGIYMALSWDQFFTNFHRVFFEGDSWLFRYSDTLIRLFPIRFWIDVAATLVGVIVVGSVIVLAGAWWWRRHLAA